MNNQGKTLKDKLEFILDNLGFATLNERSVVTNLYGNLEKEIASEEKKNKFVFKLKEKIAEIERDIRRLDVTCSVLNEVFISVETSSDNLVTQNEDATEVVAVLEIQRKMLESSLKSHEELLKFYKENE